MRDMKTARFALLLGACLLWPAVASAQSDCEPHCDFTHYYGPSDYTYREPGLFGYPSCGPGGSCSPYLTYRYSGATTGQRILIQPRARSSLNGSPRRGSAAIAAAPQ
jgi:hypothetical protein